ncbi:hypothetical protein FE783_22925 [Paenibacillus mesophilus]|uniref:hypothetical protein n=1 Tax=Paenibacillus mesophilus TaxID=2582849 RepID=UPI00110D8A1A|nr:hypothetical protein [Paenibacillus mesophilus]TMV47102.1 hypothetical protein FE783_22925 [Paenibacillus mesophilus]
MSENGKEFERTDGKKSISRRKMLAIMGTAGAVLTLGGSSVILARKRIAEDRSGGSSPMPNTLAELKNAPDLTEGMTIRTTGYHTAGDGGGAEYVVKADTFPADGGSVINLSNGLQAHLLSVASVNYKLFGAVGDGKNDDGVQIKKAHAYANRSGVPVVNLSGEYWIKETNAISILTNVQWGHTKFHIDEKFNSKSDPRFVVTSRKNSSPITLDAATKASFLAKLKPGTAIIPELASYKNCLVVVADSNDKIGFRYGEQYNGQSWAREELFYVEEHGRIIGDLAWTFKNYTSLTAYPCDDNYLVIDGGTFYMSGDSPGKNYEGYRHNGFVIKRSRTVIRNQWVGLEPGKADVALDPRQGFYTFSYVYDVLLENVRLIPWEQNRGGQGKDVPAGTYGIGGNRILGATFRNVTAEGSQVHWGVFGTNLNKNFRVEGCRLNRIDVHFHCWNLYVRDSEIGRFGLTVTGGGNLFIDNTTVMGNNFINFRNDFGSKWDGHIRLRNCRLVVLNVNSDATGLLFNPADFDYKYPIGYGRTIKVEDFVFDFTGSPEAKGVCRLMKTSAFSKMKHGERLFFPYRIEFENVAVAGREQGVRLLEIRNPFGFDLGKQGGYDGQRLETNCHMRFANIQTEKLPPQASQSTTQVHFLLQAAGTGQYEDGAALYPRIEFVNCGDFFGHLQAGAADVSFQDCTIRGLDAYEGGPMRGRLSFDRCRFQASVQDDGKNFCSLDAALGTSFVNCIVEAPLVDGQARPDLLARYGFIEMNHTLRFNHLNTRLAKEITDHYAKAGTPAEPEFITMLKSHHESESIRMIRRKGTGAQRPDRSLLGSEAGFGYYDTDSNQMVVWDGSGWTLPVKPEEALHYYASGTALTTSGELKMKRMEGHPTQEYKLRANGRAVAYSVDATPQRAGTFTFDIVRNGEPWQVGLGATGVESSGLIELPAEAAFTAGDRIGIRLSLSEGAADDQAGITIDLIVLYDRA